MANMTYTLPEALFKLNVALKEKLAKFESDVQEMRARELVRKEGRLAKHELCPLCGGPDRNGICNCLRKNAAMGYPQSTPGTGMPGGGPQSGGTQPMGMSEKGSEKKCPRCGAVAANAMHNCPIKKNELHLSTTAAIGGPMGAGPGKLHIASAGRARTSAAGSIGAPTMKAEMSKPYAAKVGITDHRNKAKAAYGDGPHDQRPAMHQAAMGPLNGASPAPPPVKKGEQEMAPTPAAPEKAAKGTKMPKAGKSADAKKPGSGGEIKSNPLRKDAATMRAPEGAGVPGKQPVGMGGGDAHKVAATAGYPKAKLPLAGVGAKGVPQGPPKSVDVDVSSFDKGPTTPGEKFSALKTAGRGEVKRLIADKGPTGNPNVKQGYDAGAALKQDKRAGGVGFLNALISKFRPQAPVNTNINPDGTPNRTPVQSQRFHGATPLQRSEKPDALKYAGHAEVSRLKRPKEDLKTAGTADVKRMKAYRIMKAEDMGSCAVCKKPESKCLCKGMSLNHNRTMLKVSTRSKAKKSR